ncbi:hypothetical protein GWI33_006527 [Rhynchophorus ferrugineus]|uniref:Uncharacterized protein n=1 Tax=Rhynchophorus ferrugineus TaxID=354439 RepID=A0A834MFD3_RHYFE|nr:hypothetical protein GWI33_006527 [Rhynchophorus ferrugineus]
MSGLIAVVLLVICIGVTVAEPPRWRSRWGPRRFQRIEALPDSPAVTTAPVPHTVYGPPSSAPSYGPPAPPSPSYGPPPSEEPSLTTTALPEATTTALPTTVEPLSEPINGTSSKLQQTPEIGVYYIYHPSGLLQKVRYETRDDTRNMAFSARLKYENVEPISGPIYTYDPQNYLFQRIQK